MLRQWTRSFLILIFHVLTVVIALTGCGGEGGSNRPTVEPPEQPMQPPTVPRASVSGTLMVGDGQVLDGDTNDPNDPEINNNSPPGQAVSIPVNIGGYANKQGDEFDIYRVTIQRPTTIVLTIAEPREGDLDLFLTDTRGMIIRDSLGTGHFEMITTNTNERGEFFIIVGAFSGRSNYILSIGVSTSTSSISSLLDSSEYLSTSLDFVNNEIIIKPSEATNNTHVPLMVASVSDSMEFIERVRSPSGSVLIEVHNMSELVSSSHTLQGNADFSLYYANEEEEMKAHLIATIKKLRADPTIEYVEPNYLNQITATPNDEFFSFQWHYPLINLPQAWDVTTGSDNVVVAVIDSGLVTNHPDFANRLLRDTQGNIVGFDFISDPRMARDGDGIDANPLDNGDLVTPTQSSFHGTHVAGTIGAATNNRTGVAGVTWSGKIMPLRVLGVGGGTDFDIAQAILYAARQPNVSNILPPVRANIINMSLGPNNRSCGPLPPPSQDITRAITAALNAGVIVIVAAGNNNCAVPVPMSTVNGVISVSAVDLNKQKAPYSNFSPTVDVAAPGGDVSVDRNGDGKNDGVLSTLASDTTFAPKYVFYQGTSMAAPHMAGVVALMLSVNPTLTPDDINRLLAGTHPDPNAGPITQDLGLRGRDDIYGHGLIDAFLAVNVARRIRGGGGGRPPAPNTPVLVVTPETINFGATATSLQVTITNAGTGQLMVQTITENEPWLTVDTSNFPTLTVAVARAGLSSGTFVGSIVITSNGGNKTIPVSMQVQATNVVSDVGTLYVLLIDPVSLETISQAQINAVQRYAYQISDIAAGRYLVVAGTDRNDDGIICDNGEACGVFPLLDSPSPIDVGRENIPNINFAVSYDLLASGQTVQSLTGGEQFFRGFHRLDFTGNKHLPR